jgi:hypothetical protein
MRMGYFRRQGVSFPLNFRDDAVAWGGVRQEGGLAAEPGREVTSAPR